MCQYSVIISYSWLILYTALVSNWNLLCMDLLEMTKFPIGELLYWKLPQVRCHIVVMSGDIKFDL